MAVDFSSVNLGNLSKSMVNMGKKNFLNSTAGLFFAATFACFLWGSASPCIKLGYQLFQIPADAVMSQILFAGIRFTLAGVLTVILGSVMEHRVLRPKRSSIGMLLTLALTQTIVQYIFFYLGLSKAPGYKGSVISPSSVFFSVLLSTLVFRQEKLTLRKILGCIIGFSGVVLISVQSAEGGGGFRFTGEGFLVLAAFSAACSTVLIKRFSSRENPVTLSGYQFIIGGSVMVVMGILNGGSLQPLTSKAWLLMLYMGLLSAVAYTLWSMLLQRHPVSRVTIFTFMNPVCGVFLSALILGEGKQLNLLRCILALILVSLGIWVVNGSGKKIKE